MWGLVVGRYLDDPTGNCWLAEFSNDKGQDRAGCNNDKDLGHDTGLVLDALVLEDEVTYAKQHTKTTTHDLHDKSMCLASSFASCWMGTICASVCNLS
jgi:hypothetical protein